MVQSFWRKIYLFVVLNILLVCVLQGVSICIKKNNNEDDGIATSSSSSLRTEKSQQRKLGMDDSDETPQQLNCQDRNGTFYVDIIDKKKDCLWLSDNTDRFQYLCRYLQVAHKCRKLCKACHYFPVDDNDSDSENSNDNNTTTTIIVDYTSTEEDDDDDDGDVGDPLVNTSPPDEGVLNPDNNFTFELSNETDTPFGVVICFSGNMMVQKLIDDATTTTTTERIRMEDLKIGDTVRVAENEYSRVYSFGHYQRNVKVPFLQIHHQLTSQQQKQKEEILLPPLEISNEHMVYVLKSNEKKGSFVPAGSIRTGDVLLWANGPSRSVDDDEKESPSSKYYTTKVEKINSVRRKGAYAPFTESGTILVNDILASNYISMFPQQISIDLPVTEQWLYHSFQAPQRLVCRKFSNFCRDEAYNEETGISVWVEAPFQFFQEWLPSTTRQEQIVSTLFILTMIPMFALISGICNILNIVLPHATESSNSWVSVVLQILLPILLIAAFAYGPKKKKC